MVSELFSVVFFVLDIDLKFAIWICRDIIQIMWLLSRVTFFYMSYCLVLKVRFPDNFGLLLIYWLEIWIGLDAIQVKINFCRVWPSFNWVISLLKNEVFQIFVSCLLWYRLEICCMNLSWHNTDQVWLLTPINEWHTSYFLLLRFSFPDFSLPSLTILTSN